MRHRLRTAAWVSLLIVGVCALSAVQLVVDVWTYREERTSRPPAKDGE